MDLFFQHFTALLMKNWCNSKRNLKGLFCEVYNQITRNNSNKYCSKKNLIFQIALPIILVIITELMILFVKTPPPPLVLTPWLYGHSTVSFVANRNPAGRFTNEYVHNLLNGTGMGVRCMWTDPLEYTNILDSNQSLSGNVFCFTASFGGNCTNSALGLLNPEVDPRNYKDFRCPCESGVAVCPSNISGTGLWKYGSVSSDEFYDLSGNDIRFWAIRTHWELKHIR